MKFISYATFYAVHTRNGFSVHFFFYYPTIIVAVTEGPVREEQLLHDMCLLGAVTVEITQILTRAGLLDVSISEPL